ncbi:MAG TPA: (Fe-S)-binding protein [Syntrophorhabdaceae bacterium]|jgi:Fe-S oxidoreductase|nr:(Fe-S)-binding protein [Syntrophorhabdaceae bacterium]HOS59312.1 (Fe-S)-binding protein [Syntrophorhabdaceae bacterium]HPL41531.1 (Fe-S)-binding protein [Syntrophorhabdaceae bacterium]
MAEERLKKPDEILNDVCLSSENQDWFNSKPDFRRGTYLYSAPLKHQSYLGLPNQREWNPADADWKLPENWKEVILSGMADLLRKHRSFRLFLDICVRCGACADKCHFFLGSGDPKNMPVLRAELLRSVYRRYFTLSGRLFGRFAGARDLDEDVLKEWFYYFYQCTECRRCSVYCPYGIDTCEITMMGRDLLNRVGCNVQWVIEPASNCFRTGNHLGVPPHAFKETLDFAIDEIKGLTGISVEAPINKKGAEILFVAPSADYFANPHWFTLLGYLMMFREIGLDYTWSAYASEGGNFGLFHSAELAKRLNAKIYAEAKRLGVRWILGGECGHMWRTIHQYMDTFNGPADFLEEPVSPVTGTKFENAKSTKMIHICEFTADLIYNNALKLDKSRNDKWSITFHDSCNPARSMGLLEEPRYIIKNTCNNFYEMPENTIREKTFCCGSGAGLGADENLEMRLRGGFPRANAVKYVQERHGVNMLACICAIDKAAFPPLLDYWVPEVGVCGVHELLGNALIMEGETERTTNLRGEALADEAVDDIR